MQMKEPLVQKILFEFIGIKRFRWLMSTLLLANLPSQWSMPDCKVLSFAVH